MEIGSLLTNHLKTVSTYDKGSRFFIFKFNMLSIIKDFVVRFSNATKP